jgi:eukaryotic-like serine/threonine-protein kinase
MGGGNLPNDPQNTIDPDSDRTRSASGPGGEGGGQIGPYRLLRLLGEGGMGEVWLAEQKHPIHRTVALKLIKAGMDTKAVVARFESERQALAMMDHPSIARVYDASSTAEGRPYFVMEYVPGLPITEYCDKHRLTIKERLELFMQVCEGVQHAHQKAIIHRDLKPSNVLVVDQNDKAVPKIIDFGLAKATAQRLTDKTLFTELGVMLGTPEYMSPEQADQREQNIDTRTDVYSLGVILYQLLVGALPFDAKALRAAGFEELLRRIREEEPPKPSTKIRAMGAVSAAAAEKRKEEPRSFAQHLRGELDWITMKALEKDRARRYGAVSELSADISRYLVSEPVVAGPSTATYRVKKYAVRHRIALGAATGLVFLLTGFAVTEAVELRRITVERDRATRERDRANRITEFMTNMFKVSIPSESWVDKITANQILDRGSAEIDADLANDPEIQAQMLQAMGNVYQNFGIYSRAQSFQQRSMEIRQHVLGRDHPDTLASMNSLADVLADEGHYTEAEDLDRKTLDVCRRTLGPKHPDTLSSMNSLADVLRREGNYAEAEKLDRETLAVRRSVLRPDDRDTLSSMNNLALVLQSEGQYSEAESLGRQVLDKRRRVLGPTHSDTLSSLSNLANVLLLEGQYADAEKLDKEALDAQTVVFGPTHPYEIQPMINLATDLQLEGKYAEAEQWDREMLIIERLLSGPENPDITVDPMNRLAAALDGEGRYSEEEELDRETLDIQRRVLEPEDPKILSSMSNLAVVLSKEGHYAEAEKLQRTALDTQRRILGTEHPDTANSKFNLGRIAARRGQRDEALSLLSEAVDHGLDPSFDSALDTNADFKSLHGDPRFDALVAHAKERAAAPQKPN